MKRLLRAIARWHHRAHVKDLEFAIAHHERLVLGLPGEIRRLNELRRYHQGRADTLSAGRNLVSWTLGRVRRSSRPIIEKSVQ
jgi:hypothetical protein